MAYFDTPMTKLEAVNICLSAMGEPSVSTLDGQVLDAQIAADLIDETSRTVQAKGWHWNLERRTLTPNVQGQIVLPPNVCRIDSVRASNMDCIQRGNKLFNVTDKTFTFSAPVEVDIYIFLPWEELSFAVKNFITIRSSRLLQQRLLGSEALFKFSQADEQQAWIVLMQDEAEIGDYNTLWDNDSTKTILSRGYFARGYY